MGISSSETREEIEPVCVIKLGREMRLAQKKYFKSRSSEDLQRAKELEREFDIAVSPQINLFA